MSRIWLVIWLLAPRSWLVLLLCSFALFDGERRVTHSSVLLLVRYLIAVAPSFWFSHWQSKVALCPLGGNRKERENERKEEHSLSKEHNLQLEVRAQSSMEQRKSMEILSFLSSLLSTPSLLQVFSYFVCDLKLETACAQCLTKGKDICDIRLFHFFFFSFPFPSLSPSPSLSSLSSLLLSFLFTSEKREFFSCSFRSIQ